MEPDNTQLQAYAAQCQQRRSQSLPTLPVALATEQAINPFLRSRLPSVATPVRQHDRLAVDDVTTFAALRQWKNDFR